MVVVVTEEVGKAVEVAVVDTEEVGTVVVVTGGVGGMEKEMLCEGERGLQNQFTGYQVRPLYDFHTSRPFSTGAVGLGV